MTTQLTRIKIVTASILLLSSASHISCDAADINHIDVNVDKCNGYSVVYDYDQALKCYLDLSSKTNNTVIKSAINEQVALIYLRKHEITKGLDVMKDGLQQLGSSAISHAKAASMLITYSNLLIHKGLYELAMKYLTQASNIISKSSDQHSHNKIEDLKLYLYTTYALYYNHKGNYSRAEEFISEYVLANGSFARTPIRVQIIHLSNIIGLENKTAGNEFLLKIQDHTYSLSHHLYELQVLLAELCYLLGEVEKSQAYISDASKLREVIDIFD